MNFNRNPMDFIRKSKDFVGKSMNFIRNSMDFIRKSLNFNGIPKKSNGKSKDLHWKSMIYYRKPIDFNRNLMDFITKLIRCLLPPRLQVAPPVPPPMVMVPYHMGGGLATCNLQPSDLASPLSPCSVVWAWSANGMESN